MRQGQTLCCRVSLAGRQPEGIPSLLALGIPVRLDLNTHDQQNLCLLEVSGSTYAVVPEFEEGSGTELAAGGDPLRRSLDLVPFLPFEPLPRMPLPFDDEVSPEGLNVLGSQLCRDGPAILHTWYEGGLSLSVWW